ncbi:MAG: zinc ribbon domain-containing protein [Chloroflexota bacterium]|nr:zinc ribbon domain-containing protein [Chloroflexota bacterium]
MSVTRFCEHCGAPLAADALFCEACGRAVSAPSVPTTTGVAAPTSAPAKSSRPPWLIVGGVAIVVVIACVAVIAVGAFFFFRSTSQALATPTLIAIGSPSTPALPISTATRALTLAITATTPTATPTQTPACPPTPALPAGVLFNEDFSSRQVAACNDWADLKLDNADAVWSPNAYTISIKKPNSGAINTMELPDRQYADFALETEAQPLDDNVSVYGLVFRFSHTPDGQETYYRFALFPDGRYSLNKLAAGNWVRVVDYTASPLIKTGKNKNTLGVIAQGSTFSLYINRTLVKTITDDSIKGSGTIGITAGNAANVPAATSFTRLTVLTPDKAKADWGGTAAPAPPTVSNLPQATLVPPTLAAPPGLYVSALRLDPGPKRGVDITFYPTFLNTTGGTQSYRVKVYLYRAENLRNSFGETSPAPTTIPVGLTEQKAGSWKLGSGGCEDFIARVGWIDDQNRITFFNAPVGGTFELRFPMCQ